MYGVGPAHRDFAGGVVAKSGYESWIGVELTHPRPRWGSEMAALRNHASEKVPFAPSHEKVVANQRGTRNSTMISSDLRKSRRRDLEPAGASVSGAKADRQAPSLYAPQVAGPVLWEWSMLAWFLPDFRKCTILIPHGSVVVVKITRVSEQ